MWYEPNTKNAIVFYHKSTTNAVKAVLSFFKDVYIVRNKDGEEYGHRVPLRFAGKDVMIQSAQTPQRKLDRDIGEVLPAMSLEILDPPQPFKDAGITGDPKLQNCLQTGPGATMSTWSGRPFQLNLQLTLRANKHHELFNMYEVIMSRLWRSPVSISILETDMKIKRDIYLGNVSARWGQYDTAFQKGTNNKPIEILIDFVAAPIFFYPPIENSENIIKHIDIDFIDMDTDLIMVEDNWDIDPPSADVGDPHEQVLTQTLFGETHEIIRDEVN